MRILDHPVERLPATLADLARRWRAAGPGRERVRPHLDDLRLYVEFVGYPCSGHSLVGALLDAHPEVVLAHELGALKYLYAGFGRERVFGMILEASRRAAETGRRTRVYRYDVHGAWAGRFERLRVVGDKHGEGASRRIAAFPRLLTRLRGIVGLDVRFVHVVRNPWDVIASTHRRQRPRGRPLSLDDAIDYFFELCVTVRRIRGHAETPVLDLRHEALVGDPRAVLRGAAAFLDLEAPEGWLDACTRLVRPTPNPSRRGVTWSPAQREAVAARAACFPWLEGYAFDG